MGLHLLLPSAKLTDKPGYMFTCTNTTSGCHPLVVLGTWAVPASAIAQGCPYCTWGPWTPSLRSFCVKHFSGKYKKPSSGQLEGVGLASKEGIFLLLLDLMPVWPGKDYSSIGKLLAPFIWYVFLLVLVIPQASTLNSARILFSRVLEALPWVERAKT